MSKTRRTFDLTDLFAKILGALFGLFRSVFDIVFPRDQAQEAGAAASQVRRDVERLIASEPEPEPRHDLATTVRAFVRGLDVDVSHLPPRQRLMAVALFERHMDLDCLDDHEVEAYVRGNHRDLGLPDVIDPDWFKQAYAAYLSARQPTSHVVDGNPDFEAPAFGM